MYQDAPVSQGIGPALRAEFAYQRACEAALLKPSIVWPQPTLSMAQRLSANRALRHGAVDITVPEHVNRLYHMHRRIEESYTLAERRKDPNDATVYPVYKRRTGFIRGVPHRELTSYTPKGETPHFGPVIKQQSEGDDYAGWSICKSHVQAIKELPPRPPARQRHEYELYHRAITADILGTRMYRERQLRELFHEYLKKAPVGEKEVVEQVILDLSEQFDVRW